MKIGDLILIDEDVMSAPVNQRIGIIIGLTDFFAFLGRIPAFRVWNNGEILVLCDDEMELLKNLNFFLDK